MPLKIDTSEESLRMILRDYQEAALRYLWRLGGEGASSRDVCVQVNESLKGERTISRASIINFLNAMVDEGLLNYTEIMGRGGPRRIYSMKYDEAGFKEYVVRQVMGKLLSYFPEETRKAIEGSGLAPS
jgi:hypothetical protein